MADKKEAQTMDRRRFISKSFKTITYSAALLTIGTEAFAVNDDSTDLNKGDQCHSSHSCHSSRGWR